MRLVSIPGNPSSSGFLGGYSPGQVPGAPMPEDNAFAAGTLDSRARNALILGILGVPLSILAGIPAILVGAHALRRIAASNGALRGRGIAWCGIVLGSLSVVAFVAALYVIYR